MSDSSRDALKHLAKLTGEQREVLELRVVHGLSAEQVASALGFSVAAVKLVQHQALEALRDALRREAQPG